ncbi:hypothetical protein GCM10010260_78360 [Streptomyces filipinensis]|uniref:Cysteinyl-tRNA synthetase n=1 Tax=Streptomyces filipinensis TaxID=66887 RepID=A0A918IJG2_9ACTN|nr:hypothetical protein GCM10010260_78360 [Streptomyces filipinensis]
MPAQGRSPAYARPVLRILDARTGEPVPAAPARRGLTRIEAYASGLDPTALRVLLTADLLVRALELSGTPVWTILTAPHRQAELRAAATTLSIRPFEDGRDLASGLGEAQAIHVTPEGADVLGAGPVMLVAPVRWREGPADGPAPAGAPTSGGAEPPGGAGGTGPGVPDGTAPGASGAGTAPGRTPGPAAHPAFPVLLADPAALRLALCSVPRGEAVRLDSAVLGEAAARLARWRRAVAGWARQPSRPVPDEVRARLRAAWEDDLDLPGVLDVLRSVESAPDLPDGARFETYVYADRLLALDLARDLGSLA